MCDDDNDDEFVLINATESLKLNATIYSPLPVVDGKVYVRLVELKSVLDIQENIQVNLHVYDLNDEQCPPYQVLSYVWESPIDVQDNIHASSDGQQTFHWISDQKKGFAQVSCDGKPLNVTKSLDLALRSQYRTTQETRLFWIDQISVNQQDILEKNQQVSVVPRILQNALQTLVWLSAGTALPRIAESAVEKALKLAYRAGYLEPNIMKKCLHPMLKGDHSEEILPPVDLEERDLMAIEVVIRSSWFHRTWSIHEVVHSKKVVLVYGDAGARIDLDSFLCALHIILPAAQRKGILGITERTDWMVLLNRYRDPTDSAFELSNLFRQASLFSSLNENDRVFALLGFTTTPLTAANLRVDYDAKTRDLYARATCTALQEQNNLDMLEIAGCRSNPYSTLPSWALSVKPDELQRHIDALQVDLNLIEAPANLRMYCTFMTALLQVSGISQKEIDQKIREYVESDHSDLRNTTNKLRTAYGRQDFKATKDSKPRLTESDPVSSGVLSLEGHLIDKITSIAKVCPKAEVPKNRTPESVLHNAILGQSGASLIHQMVKNYNDAADNDGQYSTFEEWDAFVNLDSKYHTGETMETVYRKTITAAVETYSDADMDEAFRLWRRYRTDKKIRKRYRPSTPGPHWLAYTYAAAKKYHYGDSAKPDAPPPQVSIFNKLCLPAEGRRLGWTENKYLCLLPDTAENGDHVVLFPGARLPFLLRHYSGDRYLLIGPLYMHGVMYGEKYSESVGQKIELV